MSLCAEQIRTKGHKPSWSPWAGKSGRWIKNQTARKARRVPVDQVPGKVIKGWAD